MKTILRIYIRGIVQIHRKVNGWSNESISRLLKEMNRDGDFFNICARGVRGKYSYSKMLSRIENGYKF